MRDILPLPALFSSTRTETDLEEFYWAKPLTAAFIRPSEQEGLTFFLYKTDYIFTLRRLTPAQRSCTWDTNTKFLCTPSHQSPSQTRKLRDLPERIYNLLCILKDRMCFAYKLIAVASQIWPHWPNPQCSNIPAQAINSIKSCYIQPYLTACLYNQ